MSVKSSISVFSQQLPRRKIYLWNRVDNIVIQSFFTHFNEHFLCHSINTPINILWGIFKKACIKCMDNIVPSKFSSVRQHQPWITANINKGTWCTDTYCRAEQLVNLVAMCNIIVISIIAIELSIS